jgi:glycosyltransferase involved in cell wall biosynthesis
MDDWECIILDDGSTDDTPAVAEALAAEDPRIRVRRLPHAGIVATLNAGVDEARGEWIQVIDDDDWIHEDKLRFQLEWAARRGVPEGPAVLYGDYVVVNGEDSDRASRQLQVIGAHTTAELLHGMLAWNGGSDAPLRQGSSLIRRSAFRETRFDPRVTSFVDTKLYVDLLLRGLPFLYTPFAGYYQFAHADSYTSDGTRTRRGYVRYLEILSRTVPELVSESPRFGVLAYYALREQDWKALRLLLRIARRTPFAAPWRDRSGVVDLGPPIRSAARARCPAVLLPLFVRVFLGVERLSRRALARHHMQTR